MVSTEALLTLYTMKCLEKQWTFFPLLIVGVGYTAFDTTECVAEKQKKVGTQGETNS